ncbi:unnamed protein product [Thelazia callipaeda]|uniref:CHHC U11-48K-type domain-containing protein n=1 Tax=Thelazia callipaeda TaxID=103827 RepID=A0A0N5CUN1_THECL|nr:unnamed protein product [Thelazia callipaeda]
MPDTVSHQLSTTNVHIQNNPRIQVWILAFTLLHLMSPSRCFIQLTYHDNAANAVLTNDLLLMKLLKRSGGQNWAAIDPKCGIYRHQTLHAIMDRVCELCHEMFSYKENSLRAECRSQHAADGAFKQKNIVLKKHAVNKFSLNNNARIECIIFFSENCFRNKKFRKCLQIFSPSINAAENTHMV